LPIIAASASAEGHFVRTCFRGGVLMSLPVVILVLMMQRYLVRGLTLGAVKG
jgi:multiple sugar transport system permease protein